MVRKLLFLICFVLVMAFAFVGAVQAITVLPILNPGFENGPVGPGTGGSLNNVPGTGPFADWETWTWSNAGPGVSWAVINTVDKHTGAASAEFGNIDALGWGGWAGGSGAFQETLATPGVSYSISAYGKGTTTNGASGIDLIFFNTIPLEDTQDPPNIGRFDLQFGNFGAADLNGWRYGILTAIAPAGTVAMKFEINNNGDPHSILYDDIVGTPEPATMVLLGLGSLALLKRKKS